MLTTEQFIKLSLEEDFGAGDHTSLACIPSDATGKARLLVKEPGIIAGVDLAEAIFKQVDAELVFSRMMNDGDKINIGDVVFTVEGSDRSILGGERLVLNCMQRMSGIATNTRRYVDAIKDYPAKVLDTRKTTPLLRNLEKLAVVIGGGMNHRMGLYDMILIKDNHVDYCGGIENAIRNANDYLNKTNIKVPIEIETRNLQEVNEVLNYGNVSRIMLDNFTPALLKEAVTLIGGRFETEASGGITLDTIVSFAASGVDFISVGALTHSVKSLDLSLKAV